MTLADPLPQLVQAFVHEDEAPGRAGAQLLDHVHRHVRSVARPYPDAYFALGRKDDEALSDLGHRVFTTCARVAKGRFPFQGREPFLAYVEERFDGRAIRYHSFYARLSVTRELLRDDYARNLRRDPALRWRAALYADIGEALKAVARPEPQGGGVPPRWSLEGARPALRLSEPDLVARLRALRRRDGGDLPALVRAALQHGGPTTQSRLTHVIEAALGGPPQAHADDPAPGAERPAVDTRMAVRQAVLEGWSELDADEQALLLALARGDSYDALIAACPRFQHKVAVSRAVSRLGRVFVARIQAATGRDEADPPPPRQLVEQVLEVLDAVLPELGPRSSGGAA